jgi:hypothetical protein
MAGTCCNVPLGGRCLALLTDRDPHVLIAAARFIVLITPLERATHTANLSTALAVLSHDGDTTSQRLIAQQFHALDAAERKAHIGIFNSLLHASDTSTRALAVSQVWR